MQFIISGSRGTDDPTMATLPFMAAKVAREQGHDVILFLWNEAVTLARPGVGDNLVGVNLPPLKDLLDMIQAAGIPVWVCGACAMARKVAEPDLIQGGQNKDHGRLYPSRSGTGEVRLVLSAADSASWRRDSHPASTLGNEHRRAGQLAFPQLCQCNIGAA
jgi:uncharacterized protein involved in oxidation of intracellular sulfur